MSDAYKLCYTRIEFVANAIIIILILPENKPYLLET